MSPHAIVVSHVDARESRIPADVEVKRMSTESKLLMKAANILQECIVEMLIAK